VQNLAGLVVRLVLWPIETSTFRFFSVRESFSGNSVASDTRDVPGSGRNLAVLQALHRFMVLVAAVAAVFGPNYSFTVVHILLSHRWSATEAPELLSTYSLLLVFLAVNGVTESYVHAHMSSKQLMRSNAFMAAVTVCQAAAIYAASFLGQNCHTLVLLDALSMAARIAYSYAFVWWLHRGVVGRLQAWLPARASGLALVVAFATLQTSKRAMVAAWPLGEEHLPRPLVVHAAVGAAVLGALLLMLLQTEHGLVRSICAVRKAHAE
jgi:hypothetical protein